MSNAVIRRRRRRMPRLLLVGLLAGAALSAGELENRFAQELKQASAGEAAAQFAVAQMYEIGVGVSKDKGKALSWYRNAADGGSPEAQYRMGEAYYWGRSLERDYGAALDWFRRAAAQGYSPAAGYLSKMYALGQGVERDKAQAEQWAERADTGYKQEGQDELIALAREAATPEVAAQAVPSFPPVEAAPSPAPAALAAVPRQGGTLDLVERGSWSARGRPAPWLPSELTQCSRDSGELVCLSKQLSGSKYLTAFTYRLISTLGDFTSQGRFTTAYRRQIFEVHSEGPVGYDDRDSRAKASAEQIKVGIERDERRLSCQLKRPDSIECLDEKGLRLTYESSR